MVRCVTLSASAMRRRCESWPTKPLGSGASWRRPACSDIVDSLAGRRALRRVRLPVGAARVAGVVGHRQAEVAIGELRGHASARRALQKALLDQIRLKHVLDRVALLADRGGEVVHAHRAAVELVENRFEQLAVHQVEAHGIDVEHAQRGVGDLRGDRAIGLHFGVVAHATQQAVGDTRRAARAARDFERAVGMNLRAEQRGRALHDAREFARVVELEPRDDAEAVAQRVREHARARGRADERERLEIELHAARGRPFADHDVDLIVLERRIQDFLDDRREPVNFVDEQHVVRFEIGEQRGEVARAFEHRPRRLPQIDPHFARDDVRERGLAQTGRPEQQHVVERLGAALGGFDEDFELAAHLFLPDVFLELTRAQRALERLFAGRGGRGGNHALGRGADAVGGEFVGFDHAAIVPRDLGAGRALSGRASRCARGERGDVPLRNFFATNSRR
ncbi:hypothetical protein PT2222_160067 [Paraburkholderia tropica]